MIKHKNRWFLVHKERIIIELISMLVGLSLVAFGLAFYCLYWLAM